MTDTIRLAIPEPTVIITARELDLTEGMLPAGSVGMIVMAYTPEVYGMPLSPTHHWRRRVSSYRRCQLRRQRVCHPKNYALIAPQD